MAQVLLVNNKKTLLALPDNFKKVEQTQQIRNKELVEIVRYQRNSQITYNNEHITVVWGKDGRLISYNNFALESNEKLPTEKMATAIAQETFNVLAPEYAVGLTFMRIDHLTRTFFNTEGQEITVPILWVKFAHKNGSYNWVSVGPGGAIVEVERESYWDYMASRRSTEEWNYDDWVKARRGDGPQLAAPQARA